jgi:hypothetical protein
MKDWNHDLVHQLSEDLDSLWRYREYMKNSRGCRRCTAVWKQCQKLDQAKVKMLQEEIAQHVRGKRFD